MDSRAFYHTTVSHQVEFFEKSLGPVVPYFLTILEIELSNFCNLECPFCPTGDITRERKFFPLDHFKKLIDYMGAKNLKPRISFSGDGEMFINKDILKYVAYAKEKGFHVQIITNGTLVTSEKAQALIDLKLDRIQFSVDSIVKETYEKSRVSKTANANYFERTIHNVLEYARLNYEAGSPTTISVMSVQTKDNKKEGEEFKKFWEQFPIQNVFLSPLYTLAGNASKIFDEAKDVEFHGDLSKKPVCVSPFTLFCIKTDGKVLCCTHDADATYPVGNIIENGDLFDTSKDGTYIERTIQIDKLWNNDRVQDLRKGLIAGELKAFSCIGHNCENCNVPLEGGSINEYKKGIDSYKVKKIWESMNKEQQTPDLNDSRYTKLLSELSVRVLPQHSKDFVAEESR